MSNFKLISQKLPKLIVILGPTASGKTELAIKLAKKLAPYRARSGAGFNGVEIVSADSRQVYKEMDIGTAKPLEKERKKISHHLIDVVNPNEDFNVAIYKKMAVEAIKDIQKRKKIPFLVGGTGLYIQSVVDNIDFPKVPPQKKLRGELEKKTEKELFKIYKKLDPKGAKLIDRKNKRRLIRAIEVCRVTKESFWKKRRKGNPLFDVLQIGLLPTLRPSHPTLPPKNGNFSPEYIEKIKKRVDKMFKQGLEKEVKNLVKKYGWNLPVMQTIGYQEWKKYFEGKVSKKVVKEKIKLHTIQFAKRQMTWFKRNKRIHWVKNYKGAEKLVREFIQN